MPEVSVIIPVHNREGLISRAVQSILDQTFQDFEIVIVDDHSTDKTRDEIRKIKDARIRVFSHEQNRGAQAARNTGIEKSRGRWITFLDSDDLYLVNSIEIRLKCAKEQGVNAVHSEGLVLNIGEKLPKLRRIPKMQGNIYKELLRCPGPAFPTLLISRDTLKSIGKLNESLPAYQEWDTCLRLAKNNSFGFVESPTFLYNRQGAISISKNAGKSADGYIQIFNDYKDEIIKNCGKEALGSHSLRISYFLMRAGRNKEAREWYWRSWKENPWQWRLWAYLPVILVGGSLQKLVEKIRFDH